MALPCAFAAVDVRSGEIVTLPAELERCSSLLELPARLALLECPGCHARCLLRPVLVDARCRACVRALRSGIAAGVGTRSGSGAPEERRSPVPSRSPVAYTSHWGDVEPRNPVTMPPKTKITSESRSMTRGEK